LAVFEERVGIEEKYAKQTNKLANTIAKIEEKST
jgi:hypothetical protein